jgi:hypothetical protein
MIQPTNYKKRIEYFDDKANWATVWEDKEIGLRVESLRNTDWVRLLTTKVTNDWTGVHEEVISVSLSSDRRHLDRFPREQISQAEEADGVKNTWREEL